MTQSPDANADFLAQMQAGFAEWQSRFQQALKDFQAQASQLPQTGAAGLEDWQDRWKQTVADYEEKARPYVDEMIDSLKKLADSTPDPWKPWAESAVSFTERSIRTQQEFLERVVGTDTPGDANPRTEESQ
jgi:1,2-phenylacetyl-CoA epoxidase catalytic subunit